MVRVGGGWVALDEFLVKNDPCRGMIATNCFSYHSLSFKPKSNPYKMPKEMIEQISRPAEMVI